ncbi:insulinase family protein [Streptomyces sp. NPDC006645]|uniref:M16 family metallopeptidase n=1 Tax=unclassified Streptomyces TaxID=2593676 RepID=UPI0033A0CEDF
MTAPVAPVLVNSVVGGHAVAAATLGLPLAGASRASVLAAPLVAAAWARGVGAEARRARTPVRTEPVVTPDYAGITAEAAPGDHDVLRGVADWFAAVAEHALEEGEFATVRRNFLSRTPPSARWSDAVRRALFGDRHRYGVGHDERIAHATGCEPADVTAAARDLLGPRPDVPRPPPSARRPVRVRLPAEGGAACHLLGTPGVGLGSEDKYALHVAWALLGGRDGMLDRRLRGEYALTYSLAAFSREFAEGGYGACFAACAPGTEDEVAERTGEVLRTLGRGAFDTTLVDSAKERLIIGNHRSLQSGRGVTERLCGYEIAGADPGGITEYARHVGAVTPDLVAAVARRHIGGNDLGGEA